MTESPAPRPPAAVSPQFQLPSAVSPAETPVTPRGPAPLVLIAAPLPLHLRPAPLLAIPVALRLQSPLLPETARSTPDPAATPSASSGSIAGKDRETLRSNKQKRKF